MKDFYPLKKLLDEDIEDLSIIFRKIMEYIRDLANECRGFREELLRIFKESEYIYEIFITDTKRSHFITKSGDYLSYSKNLNENQAPAVRVELSKKSTLSIFKREELIGPLYMRGFIEIKGPLSEAIKIRNMFDLFFKVFDK